MVNKTEVAEEIAEIAVDVLAVIYSKAAQGQQRGRVLFEGLVEDAEEFIRNNFPRLHSAEVGPDFTVETTPPGQTVKLPKGYDTAVSDEPATDSGTPAA